jgi:hypothetical protein
MVSVLATVLSLHPALADDDDLEELDDLECFQISGSIQIFPTEPGTCAVVEKNWDRFDIGEYPESPVCFSGEFDGAQIVFRDDDDNDKEFVSVEAKTRSVFLFPEQPDAVTVIKIKSPKLLRGKIFTLDDINFGVDEYLEVVDGTRAYKDVVTEGESFFVIEGDATATAGARFEGSICLD